MQKIKNEKGITLIALVVTIIVLGLISIPTAIKVGDIINTGTLTEYKDDLNNLAETIAQIYDQSTILSSNSQDEGYIGPEYSGSLTGVDKNPNDDNVYFKIDISYIKQRLYSKTGMHMDELNFGESNYNLKYESSDVYIVNRQSRTVYYVKGFKNADNTTLYRYPGNYTSIEMKSF